MRQIGLIKRQQLDRDVLILVEAIKKGPVVLFSDTDPGTSDLDDEQPIHVSITLGDYRRAVRLYYKLKEWEEEL